MRIEKFSYCKKLHIKKRACESSCDFICDLNKNGGTKDLYSLSFITHEFHVTKNQIRCAVRDGIIHAEIIQKKKNTIVLLEKSEVAAKLSIILTYPKNSEARKEIARNRHRRLFQKIQRNMTTESLNDLCTLEQAAKEFGVNLYNIHAALDFGIIHNCEGLRDYRTKYLLSRAEIKEKLEIIKKGNRMFYRILMKRQPPLEQHIKPEIPENNLDLQKIEMKL